MRKIILILCLVGCNEAGQKASQLEKLRIFERTLELENVFQDGRDVKINGRKLTLEYVSLPPTTFIVDGDKGKIETMGYIKTEWKGVGGSKKAKFVINMIYKDKWEPVDSEIWDYDFEPKKIDELNIESIKQAILELQ